MPEPKRLERMPNLIPVKDVASRFIEVQTQFNRLPRDHSLRRRIYPELSPTHKAIAHYLAEQKANGHLGEVEQDHLRQLYKQLGRYLDDLDEALPAEASTPIVPEASHPVTAPAEPLATPVLSRAPDNVAKPEAMESIGSYRLIKEQIIDNQIAQPQAPKGELINFDQVSSKPSGLPDDGKRKDEPGIRERYEQLIKKREAAEADFLSWRSVLRRDQVRKTLDLIQRDIKNYETKFASVTQPRPIEDVAIDQLAAAKALLDKPPSVFQNHKNWYYQLASLEENFSAYAQLGPNESLSMNKYWNKKLAVLDELKPSFFGRQKWQEECARATREKNKLTTAFPELVQGHNNEPDQLAAK